MVEVDEITWFLLLAILEVLFILLRTTSGVAIEDSKCEVEVACFVLDKRLLEGENSAYKVTCCI